MEHGTIQVWSFALETAGRSVEQIARWRSLLSAEEVSRADSFRGEEHRRDYIAAHTALRFILGESLGIGPREVSLAANEAAHGGASRSKPALSRGGCHSRRESDLDLRFNLSHTRGAAMVAVANGIEIGVDIEWQRPLDDLEGMAKTVMSADELLLWREIEESGPDASSAERSGGKSRAFYNLWTRKESYLKAIGLGLYRDLQGVTVPVSAERLRFESGTNYDAFSVKDANGSGLWRVLDLPESAVPMPEEYSASLCFEADEAFPRMSCPKVVITHLYLDQIEGE